MSEFWSNNFGEIASLGAAFLWASASLIFTRASHELGSGNLNRLRLVFATALLSLFLTVTIGWDWLSVLTLREFTILAVSGVIGLAIGDRFYFSALREMGPRLATQVFALNPISSIVFAWIILGENLNLGSLIGIAIAMTGVIIVTAERGKSARATKVTAKGILFASIATLFHSLAFVMAKIVMQENLDPLAASFIRMICAMATVWITAALTGKAASTLRSVNSGFRFSLALGGAILGPSLGVWVALVGINNAPVGVASTLLSLTPLFVIPLVIKIHNERVSPRAVAGAVIAFIGVALIFAF